MKRFNYRAKSIINPKVPHGDGWIYLGQAPEHFTLGYEGCAWSLPEKGIVVFSSVEVAHEQDDIEKGPQYHLSISKNGGRCTSNEAKFVCSEFRLVDAEEDNHIPGGVVRNFWMPVAE